MSAPVAGIRLRWASHGQVGVVPVVDDTEISPPIHLQRAQVLRMALLLLRHAVRP